MRQKVDVLALRYGLTLGKALASAQHGGARRKACAEWGAQFDADRIVADCWAPLLKEIEAGL